MMDATVEETTEETAPQADPQVEQDALTAQCQAIMLQMAKLSSVEAVQLTESQPATIHAAIGKTEDGKEHPALIVRLDVGALHAAALRALFVGAGLLTAELFDLAVVRAKRDMLAATLARMEETAAEASKLAIVEAPGLVLPNGQPATTAMPGNRAQRRHPGGGRGNLTPVRD